MDIDILTQKCIKIKDYIHDHIHDIGNIFDTKKVLYMKKTIDNVHRSKGLFKYTHNLSKIIRHLNSKINLSKKNKILLKLKKYFKNIYKQVCINHSI